jgi:hypothetical protein
MALTQRVRYRDRKVISGTTTVKSTGVVSTYQYTEFWERTTDYTGKKKRKDYDGLLPCSNFDHDSVENVPPFLTKDSGSWYHRGAPCQNTDPDTRHYPGRNSTQRNTENSLYVARLLAETHPFRSEFSIPVAIAELLDIGSLFKITAKSFSELAGNSYLNYRFGWVQFTQDIKTLHSITKQIERRIKEFDSLSKHGGLSRRHVFLDHNSWDEYTGPWTIWSTYGVFVDARFAYNVTLKVEGSVRWRWKAGVKISLTKLEAFNLAVSNVFDLGELDAETIWNAIPWTWLADYFVDVNSWLSATHGTDMVEPFDICITRRYKNVKTQYPVGSEARYVTKGRETREIVSRDANLALSVLPPYRYMFFTTNMYLVLLALYGRLRGGTY